MSDAEKPTIIVIKRITKKGGHHGGGWKIAYADFVTAMMAFFMLMWMLSMLNKFQLQGISNYFKTPMKDLFIENQMHNTNIPKVPTEHIHKNELGPTKATKDGKSPKKNTLIKTNKLGDSLSKNHANGGEINQSKKSTLSMKQEANKEAALNLSGIDAQKEPLTGGDVGKTDKEKANTQPEAAQHPSTEISAMIALKGQLEASLNADPAMKKYKEQLNFEIVDDGLKINIVSLKNKPMFTSGKSDFKKYASKIIVWLNGQLNKTPKKIMIIGHTDAEGYPRSAPYTNWELSADRANATRRYLVEAGMKLNKIIRVQGAGSSDLLFKKNGVNPGNRRIEVIVLTDKATKRLMNQ